MGEEEKVVEVCAEVISGELERSVMFTLTSADGTAIGQFACYKDIYLCVLSILCVNSQ